MKKIMESFLAELNAEQKAAVQTSENVVISAGAGSGKTKVLSKRFVYLAVEKNIPVEKILALTFTKKAATEMRERTYKEFVNLFDKADAATKKIVKQCIDNFSKATLSTLDSFCSTIARSGCTKYGIAPNFTIDPGRSNDIKHECAVQFFLDYKDNDDVVSLMNNLNIEYFIENYFESFLNAVLVTRPISIEYEKKRLTDELEKKFSSQWQLIKNSIAVLSQYQLPQDKKLSDTKKNLETAKIIVQSIPNNPITIDSYMNSIFAEKINEMLQLKITRAIEPEIAECVVAFKSVKEANKNIDSIMGMYNNRELIFKVFNIFDQLQKTYIERKRSENILDYSDVSQLAVDCLTNDLSLRNYYRQQYDAIMIDEFQDNNTLQRNILFLLSEKNEPAEPKIPSVDELNPEKLFFVGDDKQSIYLFRGADVSVFKKLKDEIISGNNINLTTNYRTERGLIKFFNDIFKNIFTINYDMSSIDDELQENILNHEALFSEIKSYKNNIKSSVDLLVGTHEKIDRELFLSEVDEEAFYLAKHIADMINNKVQVTDTVTDEAGNKKIASRDCTFKDFAILFRATTNQHAVEKYLRLFKIPYRTVQQKGIFNDAPINDMIALLKLALYPHDTFTLAQVLRSPFARFDDELVLQLLLRKDVSVPFDFIDKDIAEYAEQLKKFNELITAVQELIASKSCAEVITELWFTIGYRYIILHNDNYARYYELFDYLFEIARTCDEAQLSIDRFIEKVESYAHNETKIDDMEIPLSNSVNENTVQLLTIHKSKGLEYKIVFIPFCASPKQAVKDNGGVIYNEEYGLTMSLSNEQNSSDIKNIFFNDAREFETKKEIAELRRLLYVAMTRAECHLVLSGIKNSSSKDDKLDDKTPLIKLQNVFSTKTGAKKNKDKSTPCFFDLLITALDDTILTGNRDVLKITELLPVTVEDQWHIIGRSKKTDITESDKTELLHRMLSLPVKQFNTAENFIYSASHLHERNTGLTDDDTEQKQTAKPTDELSAADIGTLTHAAIEARFNNKPIFIPQSNKKQIDLWCSNFFNSELGHMAMSAVMRKTEYAFITRYQDKTVVGTVDLFFKLNNTIYIVDYKTDAKEEPEKHVEQLSVYKHAIKNLYGSDSACVKSFLFYVRTGNAVEV